MKSHSLIMMSLLIIGLYVAILQRLKYIKSKHLLVNEQPNSVGYSLGCKTKV